MGNNQEKALAGARLLCDCKTLHSFQELSFEALLPTSQYPVHDQPIRQTENFLFPFPHGADIK